MYDIERNYVVALARSQGWSEQCEEIDTWCGKTLLCKLCQKTCTQGHASSRKHQSAVAWWKHYGSLTDYLRASMPGSASTPASPGSSAAPHQAGVTAHQDPRPPPPPTPAAAPAAAPHQLGPGFAQSPLSPTPTPWAAAAPAPHHQLGSASTPASPGSSAAQLFFNPAAGVYFGPVNHIWRIPVQYPTNPRAPPKALPPPPPPRGGSCGDWTTAPVMIPHGLSPTQLQIQDGISIDLIGLYDSAPPPPPVGAWPPPPPAGWVVVESVGTWPTPEEGGDS